jgi:hypothetical protein
MGAQYPGQEPAYKGSGDRIPPKQYEQDELVVKASSTPWRKESGSPLVQ